MAGACGQGFIRPVNVVGPNQQVSAAESWIHPPSVVRANHGRDPDCVQNAFGDLRVGC